MKKTILITLILTFQIFMCLSAETVPQSQQSLKSYFNPTGAVPGTNAYNELIDTMFYYLNITAINTAQNPVACSLEWHLQSVVNPALVYASNTNFVGSISFLCFTNGLKRCFFFTNFFTSALQDNNYIVVNSVNNLGIPAGGNDFTVLNQATTHCDFTYTNLVSNTNTFYAYQIFYK